IGNHCLAPTVSFRALMPSSGPVATTAKRHVRTVKRSGRYLRGGRGLGLQPFPAGTSITGNPEFLQFSGREMLRFNPDGSFQEIQRAHVKLDDAPHSHSPREALAGQRLFAGNADRPGVVPSLPTLTSTGNPSHFGSPGVAAPFPMS